LADKEFKVGEWEGDPDILNNPDRMRQHVRELTQLLESPGKKYLDKLLLNRYHGLMAGLAGTPLSSLDAALAQEYVKGQAYECLYQHQLCEGLIASFKEHINELTYTEEDEDGRT